MARQTVIGAGDCLPRLSFPLAGSPGSVSWSQGRTASVIFLPHPGPCEGCEHYVNELVAAAGGLREWATRALVVKCSGEAAADAAGILTLRDDGGAARAQLGLDAGRAAVVQADRWGAVYDTVSVAEGDDHAALPRARELVGMAQFIDIQCPECGVPSKEWLGSSPFPLG